MAEDRTENSWSMGSEGYLNAHFPLHRACRDGNIEVLNSLLTSGKHDIYQEDEFYGWTPIHWASYFGKLSCLSFLHGHGVQIDTVTQQLHQSSAHIAAYGGHANCLKWLIEHGSLINRQDYMGETPMHKAARTGSMECISLIVSQGADLSLKNHGGLISSEVARQAGFQECANYIDRALQQQEQAKDANQTRGSPDGQPTRDNNFISNNTYHSNPYVFSNTPQAPIGQWHNNNNQSDACGMEMDDGNASSNMASSAVDVLLDQGVTRNVVPIAGMKRGREESEEDCYKRARNDDYVFMNGNTTGMNGHSTTDSGEMDMQESCENVPPETLVNGMIIAPSEKGAACDSNDVRGHLLERPVQSQMSEYTASSCLRYRDFPVKCVGLMSHYI